MMTHQLIKECFFIALPRKCFETQRANKGVVSFLSLLLISCLPLHIVHFLYTHFLSAS